MGPDGMRNTTMFISEITKNGFEFVYHATAQAAVSHILTELGSDYTGGSDPAFWASADGAVLCQNSRRMLDFNARVHVSLDAAVSAQADLDDDVHAYVMTALRDRLAA
jgi:hypothetical protein